MVIGRLFVISRTLLGRLALFQSIGGDAMWNMAYVVCVAGFARNSDGHCRALLTYQIVANP
jgi:hypothetical protein